MTENMNEIETATVSVVGMVFWKISTIYSSSFLEDAQAVSKISQYDNMKFKLWMKLWMQQRW